MWIVNNVRILLFCALVSVAAVCRGQAPRPRPGLAKLIALGEEVCRLRNQAAATLPAKAAPGFADGMIELKLARAVRGHDCTVQIVRRKGAWATAHATVPAMKPIVHPADAAGLRIADAAISGKLAIDFWPGAAININRDRPMHVCYTIAAPLNAGGAGKATLVDPSQVTLAPGPFEVNARFEPLIRPSSASLGKPSHGDISADPRREAAAFYAERMSDLYRDVLAIELSRRHGIPFNIAMKQIPAYRLRWNTEERLEEAKKQEKEKAGISLDDIDDADARGLDEVDNDNKRDEEQHRQTQLILKRTTAWVADVRTVLADRERRRKNTVQTGDPGIDPEFGPWSSGHYMPAQGQLTNVVPVNLPQDGPQDWPYVRGWKVLGPFPQTAWPRQVEVMPDIVPDPQAALEVTTDGFPRQHCRGPYFGPTVRPWEAVPCNAVNGYFMLPSWMMHGKYSGPGHDWASFYAIAKVYSPADVEVWAAMRMTDKGALWVNNRLIWESGYADPIAWTSIWRFRLPLKKGINSLLVRNDDINAGAYYSADNFTLSICLSGSPRTAEAAKSEMAARHTAQKKLPSAWKSNIGWRKDHSGQYPEATPPLAWDMEKSINVRWQMPLNDEQTGVIVAGDLAITLDRPLHVVAADKLTGKLRWRTRIDAMPKLKPAIALETSALWQKAEQNGLSKEEQGKFYGQLNGLYTKHLGHGVCMPWAGAWSGPLSGTPTSDGKAIYAKAYGAIVARIGLDGVLQWAQHTGGKGGGMGPAYSSPVLVDDRLICEVAQYPGARIPTDLALAQEPAQPFDLEADYHNPVWQRHEGRQYIMRAWDTRTGTPLWTTRRYYLANFGNRYDADGTTTPLPVRLTNGKESMVVIVTQGGSLFRADDGKALHRFIGDKHGAGSPIVVGAGDTMIITYSGRCRAVKLIMHDRDHVSARLLWIKQVDAGEPICGWLSDGKYLYGVAGANDGGHHLTVLNQADGRLREIVSAYYPLRCGDQYMPPFLAGRTLYIADTARWHAHVRPTDILGQMTAFRTDGDRVRIISRNGMHGLTGPPFCDGDRIYVRTHRSFMCLGIKDDAGRRYQAERVAAHLLSDLPSAPPKEDEAVSIEPLARVLAGTPLPIDRMLNGWRVVGPVSAAQADKARAALKFPNPATVNAAAGKYPEKQVDFRSEERFPNVLMAYPNYEARAFDLLKAHDGRAGSRAFWIGLFCVDRERTLRLDLPPPHARLWINGQAVKHGARVYLTYGQYMLAMETALPHEGKGQLRLRPRFRPSNDVKAERQAFLEAIAADADLLRDAATLAPNTDTGRRAKALLDSVK